MDNPRGRVVVRGKNILQAPLYDGPEANMIEFYGADDTLVAFFARIFTDNTWGFCTKGDADWPEMCVRYGFATLNPGASFKDIVTNGVREHIKGTT